MLLLFELYRRPLPASIAELHILLIGRSKVLPGLGSALTVQPHSATAHTAFLAKAGENSALPSWHSGHRIRKYKPKASKTLPCCEQHQTKEHDAEAEKLHRDGLPCKKLARSSAWK